jgi:Arc/MetJ-type ribon-helix-helix transcriptional regulator
MEITLSSDLEKLVQDRVARGEFENAEAMIEFALRRMCSSSERPKTAQTPEPLTPEQKVNALKEFFEEVDRDPMDASPLSDEALRRVNLYNDRRNRL